MLPRTLASSLPLFPTLLSLPSPFLPQPLVTQAGTWSEIALAFLLIAMLATPSRNFMLVFFYWWVGQDSFPSPQTH